MLNTTPKKTVSSQKRYFPKGYKKGDHKYIIVTGGVLSGLGKGIVAASIGKILKSHGHDVIPLKIDGYLNVDPGTMNPFEHGEVFVLDDGSEVDMDLGTYERFLNVNLNRKNNITTGKVYQRIIEKERNGDYLGKTVQIVPHLTGEIKKHIRKISLEGDIEIIEIGGTVGDIESSVFLEAVREMKLEEEKENMLFVHVTYVPYLETIGELKSKPTQHSVKALMETGIQPDIVVGRSDRMLTEDIKRKVSLFCNVPMEAVISDPNIENIYELPLMLQEEGITNIIKRKLKLDIKTNLKEWVEWVKRLKDPKREINVALAGKYTDVKYAYASILEALKHSGAYWETKVNVKLLETTNLGDNLNELKNIDGLIVPGGFGSRGTEGKIKCIEYSRENKIPFLGLCYGLQLAIVEFARNVCGLEGANSTEINPETPYPIIDLLPEQKNLEKLGGTMRLGGQDVKVISGTLAHRLYKKNKIRERFRHRYEVNPKYIDILEENGLIFSGMTPNEKIMQIAELTDHPFFIGTQFHPEFTSRPLNPNPLFKGFTKACIQ